MKTKDKTLLLIEEQLAIHHRELLDLDTYYNNLEVSEKTIDMCNRYVRDRLSVRGAIDALIQFRVRWCEENI